MALPLVKLRLYLSLIPLLRRRQGITFREIGEHLGISAKAAAREIPDALMLCGVPPYLPHDYISCFIDGDRIWVRFADQFKRPARLTSQEAAALLLALRALAPARGSKQAAAAAGLMRRVRRSLGSRKVRRLARQIGAPRKGTAAGQRMALLTRAVEERREVELEYFTQRRRVLSERRVRPYAIIENNGHYYLVGRDDRRKREIHFRVDRIRTVELTDKVFQKPANFNPHRHRRAEMYRSGPKDTAVKVRFAPGAARFVREISPPEELSETKGGHVQRMLRTDSLRWVVDWSLQYGDQAEIVGPAGARREAAQVLDDWLAFYRKHTK